jgi:hypothetical protein
MLGVGKQMGGDTRTHTEDREEGGELQTCAEVADSETGDLGRARAART